MQRENYKEIAERVGEESHGGRTLRGFWWRREEGLP